MSAHLEVRSTPDGRAHDLIDIVNHLTEWLEPLRITVEAADTIGELVEAATHLDPTLERFTTTARRWILETNHSEIR